MFYAHILPVYYLLCGLYITYSVACIPSTKDSYNYSDLQATLCLGNS